MTDHTTGLVAVLILVAVCIGAAITLVAQDPDVLPLAPFLGGLGVVLAGLLGLDAYHRRTRR